jgi:peptidoglycan/xylan/chitin deacetylase (PgdA/CDA1 family)
VGVDVDSLCHYYRIHGLDEAAATNAAYTVGVPRFVALFESLGLAATFYCIAEDLEIKGNSDRVAELAAAGFEIGNHTWHHRYDLTRIDGRTRHAEVAQGKALLEAAAQAPVVGFRAPGYNTSAALQADVLATGHTYDSSVFPCAPYYLAKAGVMGLMRVRGRTSRSVLGDPRVLLAPRRPYRGAVTDPHRRGDHGAVQFPVSVFGGVPLIGTALTAMGPQASAAVVSAARLAHPHLTLEFHAVDLLGLADDDLDPALSIQPDLRVSVARKRSTFEAALKAAARGARSVTLANLAAERVA